MGFANGGGRTVGLKGCGRCRVSRVSCASFHATQWLRTILRVQTFKLACGLLCHCSPVYIVYRNIVSATSARCCAREQYHRPQCSPTPEPSALDLTHAQSHRTLRSRRKCSSYSVADIILHAFVSSLFSHLASLHRESWSLERWLEQEVHLGTRLRLNRFDSGVSFFVSFLGWSSALGVIYFSVPVPCPCLALWAPLLLLACCANLDSRARAACVIARKATLTHYRLHI